MTDAAAIRFECAHCHCSFTPTLPQIKHRRADENSRHYCSRICQDAGCGNLRRRPLPYAGTCPECGKPFGSRYPKKFCSMKCYTGSTEFRERIAAQAPAAARARYLQLKGELPKPKVEFTCINCGSVSIISELKSRTRKYCSPSCYREYLAMRFDRWIASPQNIGDLSNYDEFLTQEELPCLVDGCDWTGKHLGSHVNLTHGITAEEFKRAAGFNIGSGLVTSEVSRALSEREHLRNSIQIAVSQRNLKRDVRRTDLYRSREASEHQRKGIALKMETWSGEPRTCRRCGVEFTPEPLGWNQLYCTVKCREKWFKERDAARVYDLACSWCKKVFNGNRGQYLRNRKGTDVFCSHSSKGKKISRLRKTSPVRSDVEST